MKFLSRKFIVLLFILSTSVFLKIKGLLQDYPFIVLILVSTSIYTFVNGAIKIEALKINSKDFVVDLKNDEEEDNEKKN